MLLPLFTLAHFFCYFNLSFVAHIKCTAIHVFNLSSFIFLFFYLSIYLFISSKGAMSWQCYFLVIIDVLYGAKLREILLSIVVCPLCVVN